MKHPGRVPRKQAAIVAAPDLPDEFLALGVQHEESGEKWRAGDAAKAVRFFKRAMEVYGEGIRRYPQDFDLAFNMARVQYEITQHPHLLAEFGTDTIVTLSEALQSHKNALKLDTDETPDILFNTAQVLTSLAEAIDEEKEEFSPPRANVQSRRLLEEAVSFLERCFARQKTLFTQRLERHANLPPDDGGVSLNSTDYASDIQISSTEVEEWAAIEEPINSTSLADTATTLLETLTIFIDVISINNSPAVQRDVTSIQETCNRILGEDLYHLMTDNSLETETREELFLAQAKFNVAFQGYAYQINHDVQQYELILKQTFDVDESRKTAPFRIVHADASIEFAKAVADRNNVSTMRWIKLSNALENLAEASKILTSNSKKGALVLPDPVEQSRVFRARGDVEMMRLSLCDLEDLPANLKTDKVRATLSKNVHKMYGMADRVTSGNST